MRYFWNLGRVVCGLLIVSTMLFLSGCATPNSAITKTYKINMNTTTGSNVVFLVLEAEVDSNTDVKQDAKADAKTQVDAILSPAGKVGAAVAVVEDIIDTGKVPPVTPNPEDGSEEMKGVTERGIYRGLTNGDRPTWYFSKKMDAYPPQFNIIIPGCKTLKVKNNGVRDDMGGGYLVKQSSVFGRGMAVLAAKGCRSTVAGYKR